MEFSREKNFLKNVFYNSKLNGLCYNSTEKMLLTTKEKKCFLYGLFYYNLYKKKSVLFAVFHPLMPGGSGRTGGLGAKQSIKIVAPLL